MRRHGREARMEIFSEVIKVRIHYSLLSESRMFIVNTKLIEGNNGLPNY